MTQIKPLGSRVLLQRINKDEEVQVGGIYIPKAERSPTSNAHVLAIGKDVSEVQVGQTVIVPSNLLTCDETIVKEDSIIGILA